MVALTNEVRETIKEQALKSFRALASLRPSDDGLSHEQILDAMSCLRILMNECDHEIRQEKMAEIKKRHTNGTPHAEKCLK